MTSFVNPDYLTTHLGVIRVFAAMSAVKGIGTGLGSSKGMVTMLLAGAAAALVVVADQVVSTLTDGHLLMAWIVLWALVFVAVMLFAQASRGLSARLVARLDAWSLARAQRTSDAQMWAIAQSDPRFMADLQAAISRAAQDASNPMDQALGRAWLDRHPVGTFNATYQGPGRAFRTMPLTGLPTHVLYLRD